MFNLKNRTKDPGYKNYVRMNKNSRVRNVEHYLMMIAPEKDFYVVKEITPDDDAILRRLGFPSKDVGNMILPKGNESVVKRNADGYDIKHKDQPKIPYTISFMAPGWHDTWHWVDITRYRYPYDHVDGYEIELSIIQKDGSLFVSSPKLTNVSSDQDKNKHVINLFLSIFGMYQIMDDQFNMAIQGVPIKRLNWRMLPQGRALLEYLSTEHYLPRKNRKVQHVRATFSKLCEYHPSECYIGDGGFQGYVAFCFPDKGFTILEHMYKGNATYVLGEDWRTISRLTKAEVRSKCLNEDRIEHRSGWETRITAWLTR